VQDLNQRLEDLSRDRTALLQKVTSREEEIEKLQKMVC
jgi:hypothetical protein